MPYVNIPKDLSGVEAKLLFGLTKRRLIVVALGVFVYLPLYFVLRAFLGGGAVWLMMFVATPSFVWGLWSVKDNRTIEKIALNYLKVRFFRPQIRPYQTENLYARMELAGKIQEVIDDVHAQDDQRAENQSNKKNRSLRKATKRRQKKDSADD
ncbi:MAG: PrgI family protein [Candidatus Fimivivens sp.]